MFFPNPNTANCKDFIRNITRVPCISIWLKIIYIAVYNVAAGGVDFC